MSDKLRTVKMHLVSLVLTLITHTEYIRVQGILFKFHTNAVNPQGICICGVHAHAGYMWENKVINVIITIFIISNTQKSRCLFFQISKK